MDIKGGYLQLGDYSDFTDTQRIYKSWENKIFQKTNHIRFKLDPGVSTTTRCYLKW